MASTYDSKKDQSITHARTNFNFGRVSRAITPSDSTDLTMYAKIVLITAGDIKILPVQNDDALTVTFVGCPVGFIPPFDVRRVLATGTTATCVAIDQ